METRLLDIFRKHTLWNLALFVFQLCCVPIALWWIPYSHLPLPGSSAVIIAVLAIVMSVHDGMGRNQRVLWLLLMGAFLVTELRSIRKDRSDSQQQAAIDRQAQEKSFVDIRTNQDNEFRSIVSDLKTTIRGVNSTLQTSDRTLQQTRLYAFIETTGFTIDNRTGGLKANLPYLFNFEFANYGRLPAKNVVRMTRIYVGEADSRDAQQRLASTFDKEWSNPRNRRETTNILADRSQFKTDSRIFTPDEIQLLGTGKYTVYLLVRFQYRDSGDAALWRSDDCYGLQTPLYPQVMHECKTFENDHYKVGRVKPD